MKSDYTLRNQKAPAGWIGRGFFHVDCLVSAFVTRHTCIVGPTAKLLYQSQGITCQMRTMYFFVWQGVRGIHRGAMDDEHNAGRRTKTRSHGMLYLRIGIRPAIHA
jgi:hypothetical protein